MSFLNKLQKAFGFSYEDEPVETQAVAVVAPTLDTSASPSRSSFESHGNQSVPQPSSTLPQGDGNEVDVSIIFKGVVEVLNRELPPYLRANLDEQGQRRFIFESLDRAVKDYITQIAETERTKSQKSREKERDKIRRSYDELKEKLHACEDHLARETEKALSAERQKRALTTRTNDLEQRIASLEADKEQYELENRSLLNKLRVVEVTSQMGGTDGLQAELNTRKEELERSNAEKEDALNRMAELKKQLDAALEASAADAETISRLEKQNALSQEKSNEINTRIAELEALGAEALHWKNMYQEAQMKIDRMVNTVGANSSRPEEDGSNAYDVITFDGSAGRTEAVAEAQVEVPDADDTAITVPATGKHNRHKNDNRQKRRGRKKSRKEEKDDFLNDTDWLVEASAEVENVDLVVTPPAQQSAETQQEETANDRDDTNGFPSQMSLF